MIQRTLRFLGAVALLAAPFVARAQSSTLCADTPTDLEVQSLSFKGNHRFEDLFFYNSIATEPTSFWRRVLNLPWGKKKCFDQATFELDYQRLLYHYRWSGYWNVRIDTSVVRSANDVKVRFTIHEGAPDLVDSIRIIGLDSVPNRANIIDHLPLREHEAFSRYLLSDTRDTIIRRLNDNGYPAADASYTITQDSAPPRRARVVFEAKPGTRAVLGAINISVVARDGAAPEIPVQTVRKFLGVKTGDPYRESALEKAKKNLYLTQAYSGVAVEVDSADVAPPGDSIVRVHISLTEDDMHTARVGLGYGTLDCFRTEGEFSNLNFLRSARRFDARLRVSKIGIGQPLSGAEALCYKLRDDPYSVDLNYNASMTLTEPTASLFGTQPSVTLFSEKRSEFKAFQRSVPVGVVFATTRQGRSRSLSLSYTTEYGKTEAQPAIFCALQNLCLPEDRDALLRNRRTATLGATIAQSFYDDPQYPSRRATVQLDLRHASKYVGSDPAVQFNRASIDITSEISLGGEFVLATRARAGAVVGPSFTGTSKFIPAQDRFFAGGGQTVRGFDPNDLGPKVYIASAYDTVRADGMGDTPITPEEQVFFRTKNSVSADRSVPIGGSAVVIGNLELRSPSPWLHDRLQFAAFLDAGELWSPGAERAEDRFGKLKYTPGVGVRLFTVVGVIRADIAYNPYAPRAGSAYFDTPVSQGGQLFCVSPGNTLAVTGLGRADQPPAQAIGPCVADFQPPASNSFWRKLNLTIAIGQAY